MTDWLKLDGIGFPSNCEREPEHEMMRKGSFIRSYYYLLKFAPIITIIIVLATLMIAIKRS
jgi:hypothetical protein